MLSEHQTSPGTDKKTVALFITCVVNSFRPNAGFSAVKLLEHAGYNVVVPKHQTCCGQPNYNNGCPEDTKAIAKKQIDSLLAFDHIVIPSASCAGMIKNHYPKLFACDPVWDTKARSLSDKSFELVDFLHSHALSQLPVNTKFDQTIAHHDSCSSIREAKVVDQVREIVAHCLPKASFAEINEPEACCGFGGTFCVKFSAISEKLALNKLNDLNQTEATHFTSLDSGCAIHLNRFASKRNTHLTHFAEFLAQATTMSDDA